MKTNVGAIDQWLRISLGFVLMFLAGTGVIGHWGYLGVLLLASAAGSYCPLYHAFGIDTRPHRHRKRSEEGAPAQEDQHGSHDSLST